MKLKYQQVKIMKSSPGSDHLVDNKGEINKFTAFFFMLSMEIKGLSINVEPLAQCAHFMSSIFRANINISGLV